MKNLIVAALIVVLLYYIFKKAKNATGSTTEGENDNMPLEDVGKVRAEIKSEILDSAPVAPITTPTEPFVKGATTVNVIPQNTSTGDNKEIKNGSSEKPNATPIFGNPVITKNIGAANDITLGAVVKEAGESEAVKTAKAKRKNISPVKLPKLTTEMV